ncbi:hypothetical protein PoB_006116000 [Plakobranchus ocellatus]|uniref:Uncharacterized protein n=1 Tax=Plakobranchus ocellatus TaxID=259542 RepID=A0AAV4CS37_9GAST|nr:hypothetical protein PoB_006116000 [Plakobranchus ocellatus]
MLSTPVHTSMVKTHLKMTQKPLGVTHASSEVSGRARSEAKGQGAGGGARTRDRMIPADLRADLIATVPPTPPLALRYVETMLSRFRPVTDDWSNGDRKV